MPYFPVGVTFLLSPSHLLGRLPFPRPRREEKRKKQNVHQVVHERGSFSFREIIGGFSCSIYKKGGPEPVPDSFPESLRRSSPLLCSLAIPFLRGLGRRVPIWVLLARASRGGRLDFFFFRRGLYQKKNNQMSTMKTIIITVSYLIPGN